MRELEKTSLAALDANPEAARLLALIAARDAAGAEALIAIPTYRESLNLDFLVSAGLVVVYERDVRLDLAMNASNSGEAVCGLTDLGRVASRRVRMETP